MKLVIRGSSKRISIISQLIAEFDKQDPEQIRKNAFTDIGNAVKKVVELRRTLDKQDTISGGTDSKVEVTEGGKEPIAPPVNGTATPAAEKKPAAKKPVAAPAPAGPAELTKEQLAELEELKDFTLSRGAQGHAPKIKAKLTDMGVKRAGELAPSQWNAYRVFLQTLEDKQQPAESLA